MSAQTSNSTRRGLRLAGRAAVVLACLGMATGCSTVRGWFSSGDKDEVQTEPAELVEFQSQATPRQAITTAVRPATRRPRGVELDICALIGPAPGHPRRGCRRHRSV